MAHRFSSVAESRTKVCQLATSAVNQWSSISAVLSRACGSTTYWPSYFSVGRYATSSLRSFIEVSPALNAHLMDLSPPSASIHLNGPGSVAQVTVLPVPGAPYQQPSNLPMGSTSSAV